jgi:hypothetical protein
MSWGTFTRRDEHIAEWVFRFDHYPVDGELIFFISGQYFASPWSHKTGDVIRLLHDDSMSHLWIFFNYDFELVHARFNGEGWRQQLHVFAGKEIRRLNKYEVLESKLSPIVSPYGSKGFLKEWYPGLKGHSVI